MIPNFIKYLLLYYFLTFPGITFPHVNEFTSFTHFPTGQFIHKKSSSWYFPGGSVVETMPSNAWGEGSIPGQGARIPHASCVSHSVVSLFSPTDYSPPGSSVHEILQARMLEWVAISFPRGSSQPRDRTWVSCIAGRFLTI